MGQIANCVSDAGTRRRLTACGRRTVVSAKDDEVQNGVVVVVEDDVLTRAAVTDHLRRCGFKVLEAENGEEAIGLLAGDTPVDLVFTDLQMPGSIDGFGVVRWLREHRPGMPVLVATGHVLALELAEMLCDARQTFAKPYEPAMVAATITDLLGGGAARQEFA
jgi:CheY-like chemotaxis protein